MKKPALTCKATVSPGIYADWLCSEQGWERQKDGGAIQRLALVSTYRRSAGYGEYGGTREVGIYEVRR